MLASEGQLVVGTTRGNSLGACGSLECGAAERCCAVWSVVVRCCFVWSVVEQCNANII